MSPQPLVAQDLVKRFPRLDGQGDHTVLDGACLTVEPGEALAIVGPSGSGKTTLINLFSGLDRANAGTVVLAGQSLDTLDEDARADLRNRSVGLVLQRDQLLPQCTALDNVLIPTLARAAPAGADLENRALGLLDAVGLAAFAAHRPAQLSAGQRQRVAVARALIHGPTIVLADEPTGALDRATSADLLGLLLEMRAAHGTALVIVTHDEAVVAQMDRALTLDDGRLVPGAE